MDSQCSFCQDLATTKAYNLKMIEELHSYNTKLKVHYMVALVEVHDRLYQPKYTKKGSLQSRERFSHEPKGFYYCPVCGKKLR